jgi:hypothetical protein
MSVAQMPVQDQLCNSVILIPLVTACSHANMTPTAVAISSSAAHTTINVWTERPLLDGDTNVIPVVLAVLELELATVVVLELEPVLETVVVLVQVILVPVMVTDGVTLKLKRP